MIHYYGLLCRGVPCKLLMMAVSDTKEKSFFQLVKEITKHSTFKWILAVYLAVSPFVFVAVGNGIDLIGQLDKLSTTVDGHNGSIDVLEGYTKENRHILCYLATKDTEPPEQILAICIASD